MRKNKINFFRASAEDFTEIPGSPVAYWISDGVRNAFGFLRIKSLATPSQGMSTCDVDRFVRLWSEVSLSRTNVLDGQNHSAWIRYNKGGQFRKWYGNREYVVFWGGDGDSLKEAGAALRNQDQYFKRFLAWTKISSGVTGFRLFESDFLFDGAGGSLFLNSEGQRENFLAFLNSCVATKLLTVISPTVNFNESHIGDLPINVNVEIDAEMTRKCIAISKSDWDSYETSWDFEVNPLVGLCESLRRSPQSQFLIPHSSLLIPSHQSPQSQFLIPHSSLLILYARLRAKWARDCEEMRRLETENNRIFIEAYGLQDELSPDVPWHEITLTCNPFYRYGKRNEELGMRNEELGMRNEELGMRNEEFPRDAELEERLRADTVKELVSYAVGCMMGRYSLDKPGLVLADQGARLSDQGSVGSGQWSVNSGQECRYVESAASGGGVDSVEHCRGTAHSPLTTNHFSPDEDGIIPVLDNDWFADDIVTRFKAFVKAAFGEAHYFENMAWIEEALGKDVRSYFTKDFYKDHLQRYQNRPIYWLFQSPKGAFRALVYMHRYKPDMVGGVLGYLRSLQTKIDNQLDVALRVGADESKSSAERVRANKDAAKYAKVQKELDEYEKNVLYPLSTERIEIDLDDGVKVNYRKFGAALAKVKALEGKNS